MSADWSKLSKDVQKCLLSCLRREMVKNMISQAVSNSIYGLSEMNVSWYDLSNDDRIVIANGLLRVKDDMNSQHVANIIHR